MGKYKHRSPKRWHKSQLINHYGAFCQLGNHPIKQMKDITLDHIIPISKGGLDQQNNYQLACEEHNQEKNNMSQEEWEKLQNG